MKRRRVLLTIAGLGSMVALLGLAGLIAPFTDRATTGPNSIASGERAREVDLQLASLPGPGQCAPFNDDLATSVISASNVQPGEVGFGDVCLKNAGASTVSVTVTALDLADFDTACTGDEAAVDTTCGVDATGAPRAGELSPHLSVGLDVMTCDGGGVVFGHAENRLGVFASTPATPLTTLAPGQTACVRSGWTYSPLTADAPVMAQTDVASWRFAFDGTTP